MGCNCGDKPGMSEAQLKIEVKRIARINGWAVHDTSQSRPVRPVKGEATGYPDLTLARNREVLWIELKTDTGTQSPEQFVWGAALPAYHVIRPKDFRAGRVNELLS